ncbi:hypothetical protein DP79_14735 [Escherichia coli]|uniref:Uncharacterized protein n=2 Tax=Enterobacteriaceae TaxID=543 RepID=A0A023PZU7_ECOLX|nr:hypothetical protein ECS01_0011 [Escherichia coli]AKJ21313.1 Hypothetical protein pYNKP001-NDM_0010 [Raoultella ornithinolytica]OYE78555.1 hypothetical protein CI627_00275 [Klebsiella pneumoniae subsp. pneumoniae]KCW94989.1 hypothetical protein DP79_14735 [Escherichia coli]OYE85750.1 hypothetical protein CI629_17310 [Klebsiella pneumoniae subsp. pneumoniae]
MMLLLIIAALGYVTGRRYCLPMNISIALFALKVNISKYIYYIYFMQMRQLRRCAERMGGATRRKPRSAKREDLKSVTALAVIIPRPAKPFFPPLPSLRHGHT